MKVAIHQPNYAPWLGYFAKIASADIFVFLDDVQFTKNSYINRVQVLNGDRPHWLTIPVKVHLGDSINAVIPAQPDWVEKHRSSLKNFYRSAPTFKQEWPEIDAIYAALPDSNLADINMHIVRELARILGLQTAFTRSSYIDTAASRGDERLARIVETLSPGATYLSGHGGRNYQSDETFTKRDIALAYVNFDHPTYRQRGTAFVPGLSVLDAIFELGRDAASRLIAPARA